jgi:hypothetical protein
MKKALFPALLLATLCPAAAQQNAAPGCYVRAYDASHLARNKAQRTTEIRISLANEVMPGGVAAPAQTFVRLELSQRGGRTPLRAIGTCQESASANRATDGAKLIPAYPKEAGVICVIAGEGLDAEGGFLLLDQSATTLRAYVDEEGFVTRQGADVSSDAGQWSRFGRADRIFRLDRTDAAACRDLEAAISFR